MIIDGETEWTGKEETLHSAGSAEGSQREI
jgi:hypothetical protein